MCAVAYCQVTRTKEASMSTRDRHMSPSGSGFRHGRWIAIAAAVAVAAVVVALLVLYGGGGSSTGY